MIREGYSEEIDERVEELSEYVEEIDSDVSDLEEALFLDDEDEEDDDFVELQCPECGETIYFDEDMLESGEELLCPNCNALLVPTLEEDDDGEE